MTARQLFPTRRSRAIFVLRVVILAGMIGAVGFYGWVQLGRARTVPALTSHSTPVDSTPAQISLLSPTEPALEPQPQENPDSSASTPKSQDTPTRPTVPGVLNKDVVVVSNDGLATLRLPQGTKVLDSHGQPLDSITVTAHDPQLLSTIAIIGMTYEFNPTGATFDPPVTLAINYDPNAVYPFRYCDIDCSQMHMAYYTANGSSTPWLVPWLRIDVDRDRHVASTTIDHLGAFILFCQVLGTPLSDVQPSQAGRSLLSLNTRYGQ